MRGCSLTTGQNDATDLVDPAHAGMLPLKNAYGSRTYCGPRACGDAPDVPFLDPEVDRWTPRMRGCSPNEGEPESPEQVDPAHAGMLLQRTPSAVSLSRGPRACGDAPRFAPGNVGPPMWTPRMRGCSCPGNEPPKYSAVDPAHAGMLLLHRLSLFIHLCGPRACGDAPGDRKADTRTK